MKKPSHSSKMPQLPNSTIDLHFHSRYSDAKYTPLELVYKLAHINNYMHVQAACLTDHNTLRGQTPFLQALRNYNRNLPLEQRIQEGIFGVEVSLEYGGELIHILAYSFPNPTESNPLNRLDYFSNINLLLKEINDGQRERYYQELQLARKQHPDLKDKLIETQEVLDESGDYFYECSDGQKGFDYTDISRAIAKKTGKMPDTGFFERGGQFYLGKEVEFKKISLELGLPVLREFSTEVVLAHPKRMADKFSRMGVKNMLEDFKKYFTGIEVYFSTHTQDDINYYSYLADQLNLKTITAGSDFHGWDQRELCRYQNNAFLPNVLKDAG